MQQRTIAAFAAAAVVAGGMATVAVGAGGAATQEPAVAAQSAPPVAAPGPYYATGQPRLMTIASSGKTRVVSNGSRYIVRMKRPKFGEVARAKGIGRYSSPRVLARKWNQLRGARRGVILGTSRAGQAQQIWVTFGSMKVRSKGRLVVRAFPKSGSVNSAVRTKAGYRLYSAAKPAATSVVLRSGSITATAGASAKWHFAASAPSASVTQQGGTWTITYTGMPSRLVGVQPNGSAAAMPVADVVAGFPLMRVLGAQPRIVVEGRGRDGRTRSMFFYPRKLTLEGTTLTITANRGTRLGRKGVRASSRLATSGLLLEVSNPGTATGFVVSAGDGFASGEGARFAGTYLNGDLSPVPGSGKPGAPLQVLPDSAERTDRWKKFCETVDLTCTGARVVGGELQYRTDPGIVYETGSWEQADQGLACHRSTTAPGTWLARYFATQQGSDIGHINLACSGAAARHIINSDFKGQLAQAKELRRLARWVPVSHVVATVGAADSEFIDMADRCVNRPVKALGLAASGFDTAKLLAAAAAFVDDTRMQGSAPQTANANFDTGDLCRPAEQTGWENRLRQTRQSVTDAVVALHRAAKGAQVVTTTYPALLPPAEQTYFPRQQWWDWLRPWVLAGDAAKPWNPPEADQLDQWRTQLNLATAPAQPFFDGVAAGDPGDTAISKEAYSYAGVFGDGKGTFGSWASGFMGDLWFTDTVNYGATAFGIDQEWLATQASAQLNAAVADAVKAADPTGAWSTLVDTSQLFNGREPGTKHVGHTEAPVPAVWGIPGGAAGSGPAGSRANLVNSHLAGSASPVLCPGGAAISGSNGACPGDRQEAWHANWLGQAAQGQCIVAVVTGIGGAGNACVRSIGDGAATGRNYPSGDFTDTCGPGPQPSGSASASSSASSSASASASPSASAPPQPCPLDSAPYLYSEVTGADRLCLLDAAAVRQDSGAGRYTACTGGIDPYPTWDADRWAGGRVEWNGQKVRWG